LYDLNLIPTHIDQKIARKNKKSLNYTDLPLIFHWDSAVPVFAPSAVHTGPINQPIPPPNSLIFATPKPISPQAEANREELGPEWTQGITGLLCHRLVETKRHFVGATPCGPIFGHLTKFKF
jgi:hypothetical protein